MKKIKWGILCLGMCLLASLFGFIYSSRIEAYAIESENNIYSINQISEDLFGTSEISYSCSLYNYDESEDYIYVEYKNGGYAVFFKPTMELMEYSKNGRLPYANTSDKQYYGGPNSYFRKVNGDLKNIVTGERLDYNEEQRFLVSQNLRQKFINGNIKDVNLNVSNLSTLKLDAPAIGGIIMATGEGCINNYEYFWANPNHGDNMHGTCGSVATQLLLGYHNYYTDRRIIAPEHLNGGWILVQWR